MMLTAFNPSLEEKIIIASLQDVDSDEKANRIRELYTSDCDDALWQAANLNRVAPIVGHALMDTFGSDNIPARWVNVHRDNCACLAAYLTELDFVASILAKEGILLVALKNGGIARGIYPCPGCCPMGDIDVLVNKADFRRAHHILQENGFIFDFRSPLEEVTLHYAEHSGGAEYHKTLPGGYKLWFELQWRPVAGRWIRPDQEPSTVYLMENTVSIPGTLVRLLGPEHNLLQVSLHTAKHSFIRAPGFRLHLDVDRIVRRQPINWEGFLSHVIRLQAKTPVYFSLAIPKMFFDSPIPNYVLNSLRPPLWKEKVITRWLRKAGFFNPDEKKFGRLGYVLFTILLYDDLKGLYRAIFPDSTWMYRRYGAGSISRHYFRRLKDLIFRRLST